MPKKNFSYTHNFFEKKAWQNNLLVCGIDEVGRGSLAGPIMASAIIIPPNTNNHLLKDSKILDKTKRATAHKWIIKNCLYVTATTSHTIIDTINIYQATLQAMFKAFIMLIEKNPYILKKLRYILVDSMPFKTDFSYQHENLETKHFNFGESISSSIAAASIVAKETRDLLMNFFSTRFPLYNFSQNKGYGTKKHINAISTYGPTLMHRKSFLSNIQKGLQKNGRQESIF
jgi:ribonuclease HII